MKKELTEILNRFSVENGSNTPDFILATYLLGCLHLFNQAVAQREQWYGRNNNSSPLAVEQLSSTALSQGT